MFVECILKEFFCYFFHSNYSQAHGWNVWAAEAAVTAEIT